MKPSAITHVAPATLAVVAALAASAAAQTTAIPTLPIGTLSAFPTVVQTGTKPTLTWNILYPKTMGNVATIKPPGRIVLSQSMYASVQLVGTSVNSTGTSGGTAGTTAGTTTTGDTTGGTTTGGTTTGGTTTGGTTTGGTTTGGTTTGGTTTGGTTTGGTTTGGTTTTTTSSGTPTDARLSVDGAPYQQLFYGNQAEVDPAKTLYTKLLDAGQTLDFGGRYVQNDSWSPFYTTTSSNMQVVALVKGDTPPTASPLYQQSTLASYLKPYLDGSGKVNIGPLSVLILMELNQTNRTTSTFDYQDQVLLVSFSKNHPNNGHGNNLDGVDCSNPGQGHGGPNGMIDPSGGVDDEKR